MKRVREMAKNAVLLTLVVAISLAAGVAAGNMMASNPDAGNQVRVFTGNPNIAEDPIYQEAMELLREAELQSPGNPGNHADMGILLHKTGDLAGAIEEYTAALELDPENESARWARNQAYRELGMDEDTRRNSRESES